MPTAMRTHQGSAQLQLMLSACNADEQQSPFFFFLLRVMHDSVRAAAGPVPRRRCTRRETPALWRHAASSASRDRSVSSQSSTSLTNDACSRNAPIGIGFGVLPIEFTGGRNQFFNVRRTFDIFGQRSDSLQLRQISRLRGNPIDHFGHGISPPSRTTNRSDRQRPSSADSAAFGTAVDRIALTSRLQHRDARAARAHRPDRTIVVLPMPRRWHVDDPRSARCCPADCRSAAGRQAGP